MEHLPTPCLLVDLPALERNESMMRKLIHGNSIALRPHAKAHKSSQLAAWHIRRSRDAHYDLAGFCAQTIIEAEMLVRAGASDVLITNTLPPQAAASLAALAAANPSVSFGVLVDCAAHVAALKAAVCSASARLRVLVEIECGMDRCGVAAGSDALVALARAIIAAAPALEWGGLHVYAGNLGQLQSASARRAAVVAGPAAAAASAVARLKVEGIPVPVVTGGGTGTAAMDIAAGVHTELQPGSYLLMDGNYSRNEETPFLQALFVHATCISADDATGKRVIDAGTKAVDVLAGMPGITSIVDDTLAETLSQVLLIDCTMTRLY
jgi:D-serine deaminase-like pyridoxal phosphate-dependent protein